MILLGEASPPTHTTAEASDIFSDKIGVKLLNISFNHKFKFLWDYRTSHLWNIFLIRFPDLLDKWTQPENMW